MQGIPPEAVEIAKLFLKFRKEEEERKKRGEIDPDWLDGNEAWVETKYVAPILRRTMRSIRWKIKRGKILARKINGKYYVCLGDGTRAKELALEQRGHYFAKVYVHVSKSRSPNLASAGLLTWGQVAQITQDGETIVFVGNVELDRLARFLKKHLALVRDYSERKDTSRSEIEVFVDRGETTSLIKRGVFTDNDIREYYKDRYIVFRGKVHPCSLIHFLKANRFTHTTVEG